MSDPVIAEIALVLDIAGPRPGVSGRRISAAGGASILLDIESAFVVALYESPFREELRFSSSPPIGAGTGGQYLLRDRLVRGPYPFLVSLQVGLSAFGELEEARALNVTRINYGSPFQVLLELPWQAYAAYGASFIAGLGLIFGAPHKAAAAVNKARVEYWKSRLEADRARAEYFRWRAGENSGLTLTEIDAPPFPDDRAERTPTSE